MYDVCDAVLSSPSDDEQRRLYDAAQLIQTYYRTYRRHKEEHRVQLERERELEAAVLIQSIYRRYKQVEREGGVGREGEGRERERELEAAVLIQSIYRRGSGGGRGRVRED